MVPADWNDPGTGFSNFNNDAIARLAQRPYLVDGNKMAAVHAHEEVLVQPVFSLGN